MNWNLLLWVLTLAAAVTGLALKDVRLHGATLALSLVALVVVLLHH